MKPRKLIFKGIGSYFTEQTIDFSELDNLFLICGSTGAGKTTILDAMTYALYGESSGGEREDIINSHYKNDKKKNGDAYVDFYFDIADKSYRFYRAKTPKKRADDYNFSGICAEYRDGQWYPLTDMDNVTISKMNAKAKELLQLSREQFCSVILLPQGQFENFLTCGNDEKEQILKTLFGAEKYTRFTDTLVEQAKSEQALLKDERTMLNALLEANHIKNADEGDEIISQLSQSLTACKAELEAALEEVKNTEQAHLAGAQLSDKFTRLRQAQDRYTALEKQKEKYSALNERISLLEKHSSCLSQFNEYMSLHNELDIRKKALAESDSKLKAAKNKSAALAEKENEHRKKENEYNQTCKDLTLLENLCGEYEKLRTAHDTEQELLTQMNKLSEKTEKLKDDIDKKKALITELSEKITAVNKRYPDGISALSEKKFEMESAKKTDCEINSTERQISENRACCESLDIICKSLTVETEKLEKEYELLREKYFSSVSARLAAELKEGQPCPVCGSVHHHKPAAVLSEYVTDSELSFAQKCLSDKKEELRAKQSELNNLTEKADALEQKKTELKAALPDNYSEEMYLNACREYETAKSETALSLRLSEQRNAAEKDLSATQQLLTPVTEEYSRLQIEHAKALERYRAANEHIDGRFTDIEALNKHIGGLSSFKSEYEKTLAVLAEEKLSCERELSAAEQEQKTTADEAAKAAAKHSASREKTNTVLFENGLSDADSFIPDTDGIARLSSLRNEYQSYTTELSSSLDALNEAKQDTEGNQPPDMIMLEAAKEAAKENHLNKQREKDKTEEQLSTLSKAVSDYRKKSAELCVIEEKCIRRMSFAKLMQGAKGLSFTRFMLGFMLDKVIGEANHLLANMLGGSFRLIRSTDIAMNEKQGLELKVENTVSGSVAQYSAANLSGGEKFVISLALGVSLSTVVQRHFGGISIDSLFIDEGFGSLDPSAIRDVITLLTAMHGSSTVKRTVGIISHVEALKEDIHSCISVTKDKQGSHAVINSV